MPTTVRPRGPLPARVYWTRRLLVLGVPLVLVVVLARILGGSSDATDAAGDRATQAGASIAPTPAPSAGPTAGTGTGTKNKGRKNKDNQAEQQETAPPEPVLAEPSGPCDASDIVATPAVTQVVGGQDIPLTFNLRTVVTEACTFQASAQTMTVTITSGSDFIWSSRQCPDSIPPQDVVVRNAVEVPVTLTWAEGKRSDETCSGRTDWARPGFYHVESAALGGEGTDVQFELVGQPSQVITKTADPQPQGGKNSHTPGQDGIGNSEG